MSRYGRENDRDDQDEYCDESDDSYEEDMRNLARRHSQNLSPSDGQSHGQENNNAPQKPIFQSKLLKMKSKNPLFPSSKWNKRYFTVEPTTVDEYGNIHAVDCAVCYYNSKHDIGHEPTGWFYVNCINEVRQSSYWKSTLTAFDTKKKYTYGFQVTTPTRTYHFRARSQSEMEMWIYGLSSIAGLEANHVCKWPMREKGDPPERVVHGAGHGMRAAREKHKKRKQLRQQANYSDNEEEEEEEEESNVDDDAEYEENHRKKTAVFRGRYNDGEEEAQEDIEDVEERVHSYNNRDINKKSKHRSKKTYGSSSNVDDKVSMLEEDNVKKPSHRVGKRLWGRPSAQNSTYSSSDNEDTTALRDDIRNWTVTGDTEKPSSGESDDDDDGSFLKRDKIKKRQKKNGKHGTIETIHSLDHESSDSDGDTFVLQNKKKKKKKKQLYDTRISNSGNGVTTTKSFLGLDDLSDASSTEESDDIHVNQTKPKRPARPSRNFGDDGNSIQKSIENAIRKNNRQSNDSEDDDDTPTTDLSESTNRLLDSLIRRQNRESGSEEDEESQGETYSSKVDDSKIAKQTPMKKKNSTKKSSSKKSRRKPRPPPGGSGDEGSNPKFVDKKKDRKKKSKKSKKKNKSIPKPPKGPYPPKTDEQKVSADNNAENEAKEQGVIDEDDWLMDDDHHEASKRKSRQSHKAGVEVDENFADEAWDESSMEASKS